MMRYPETAPKRRWPQKLKGLQAAVPPEWQVPKNWPRVTELVGSLLTVAGMELVLEPVLELPPELLVRWHS